MIQITDLSQIACGDCLEIMQEMPSASVDAIVTDPPYMLQIRSDGVGALSPWGDLMNSAYWYAEMLRQFKRLLRSEGACLVFMNWRGLPTLMKAGYMADLPIRGVLTWSKQWPGTGHFFRTSSELLCLFVGEKFKMRNRCLLDVQYFPPVPTAKRLHSAEKPVELLRFAIENISSDAEHDTVFDPFMGSGSTGVAAEMEGRRFIGIELDERFYDVARKRIEEVGKQQSILQYTGQSQEGIAR